MKQRKYRPGFKLEVGAYPIPDYIEGTTYPERQAVRGWRSYYTSRKPWKIVQPQWLEYVVAHAGIELVYDKPKEPERWEAWWVPDDDGISYYRSRELDSLVHPPRGVIFDYDHKLIMKRKDWKAITRAHAACVVHNLGGKLV